MNGVQFCIPALTDLHCEYMQAHDSYTETENHCVWNYQYSWSVSPGDVEPHFKLYIILMLVPLFSSCYVLGTIYAFLLNSKCTAHTFLEIRVVTMHTIKSYGSGGISPFFLNFSTIFARCFTHSRKSRWSALDRRMGCLHSLSGCPAEETNLLPPWELNPNSLILLPVVWPPHSVFLPLIIQKGHITHEHAVR